MNKPFSFCAIILLIALTEPTSGQVNIRQGPAVPSTFCIDSVEMQLYREINKYRRNFSLPPIPLSKSLSYVAALHAKDLFLNHPDRGSCNSHSWSGKGFWNAFCYPRDENKKNSVWDKPRELTRYPGKGFEIIYWENNPLVRDTILMVWQTEEYFNSFFLNTGKWQGKTWNAVGIAVYENYVSAWFGEVSDPEGEAWVCGQAPVHPDTVRAPADPPVKPLPKSKKQKPVRQTVAGTDSLKIQPSELAENKISDSSTNKTSIVNLPKDSTLSVYYIIVKTNLGVDASEKFAGTLRAGSYPGARVLSSDGKNRVSAFETTDKATATLTLKEIRKTYRDAWILKK